MSKKNVEKHIITQEDLDNNPDLVPQGVKVGDEVILGDAVNSTDLIAELEKSVEVKEAENLALKAELKAKDEAIASLKKELAEKASEPEAEFKNTDGKVIVHFGVNINGKNYSVSEILKDKDIQKYLLDIQSGAIEKVTKG